MITDVHNHVIPGTAIDLLREVPAYGVDIHAARWHGGNHIDFDLVPAFFDVEAKLDELQQNGVDGAILSPAPPLFYYELERGLAEQLCDAVNAGLAEFHTGAPERLWWLAHVPMQASEAAVEVLETVRGDRGCVGVEIGSSVAGRRLDEPEFEPFWSAAERLSLPVMIHPDPTYTDVEPLTPYYLKNVIGMPLETTITVMRLIAAGVFVRHPRLQVLLAHGGGYFPYQGGRLGHAMKVRPELSGSPNDPWSCLDQLWFDAITHDAQALRYLVSRVGSDRVLLGTDLPFDMALRDPVTRMQEAVDQRIVDQITDINPTRLFGAHSSVAITRPGHVQLETAPALAPAAESVEKPHVNAKETGDVRDPVDAARPLLHQPLEPLP